MGDHEEYMRQAPDWEGHGFVFKDNKIFDPDEYRHVLLMARLDVIERKLDQLLGTKTE